VVLNNQTKTLIFYRLKDKDDIVSFKHIENVANHSGIFEHSEVKTQFFVVVFL